MKILTILVTTLLSLSSLAVEFGNKSDGVLVVNKSSIKIELDDRVFFNKNELKIVVDGQILFTGFSNNFDFLEYAKGELEERISEIADDLIVLDLRYTIETEDNDFAIIDITMNKRHRVKGRNSFVRNEQALLDKINSL